MQPGTRARSPDEPDRCLPPRTARAPRYVAGCSRALCPRLRACGPGCVQPGTRARSPDEPDRCLPPRTARAPRYLAGCSRAVCPSLRAACDPAPRSPTAHQPHPDLPPSPSPPPARLSLRTSLPAALLDPSPFPTLDFPLLNSVLYLCKSSNPTPMPTALRLLLSLAPPSLVNLSNHAPLLSRLVPRLWPHGSPLSPSAHPPPLSSPRREGPSSNHRCRRNLPPRSRVPPSSPTLPSLPSPHHNRAPGLPGAVPPSPHNPNARPRPAKKSAQAVSRQPEPLWGSGCRETVPPFTPHQFPPPARQADPPSPPERRERPSAPGPATRHPLQGARQTPSAAFSERSPARAPTSTDRRCRTPDTGPAALHPFHGARQPPASRPECGERSSAHPQPQNHPTPTAPQTHQKTTPKHLKSFLEKTLIARETPIQPPTRPAPHRLPETPIIGP